jgi:hypothetical protein
VDVEITPEPSPEEGKAILAALQLEGQEASPPTPWRQAGLGEAQLEGDEEAAGPLRQRRGAARA